eukprot:TRINITY_DN14951_c0_g1_i1.p2 TRINITY_DN14951_c0_g1~~TRINITY_DN14951_c0_g1_i1.p2  ORF type:complete len:152 (-),score=5.27 TRINITY_DN14951_c0_g1_i1:89-544(-)
MAAGYRLPEDRFYSSLPRRATHSPHCCARRPTDAAESPQLFMRVPSTSSFTSVAVSSSPSPPRRYTQAPEASGAYPGYPSMGLEQARAPLPPLQTREVPMPSEADLSLFDDLEEEMFGAVELPAEDTPKKRKKRRSSTSNPFQRARRKSNR